MSARRSSSMGGRPPANAALRGGGLIVLAVLVGVALLAWGFSEEGGLVDTDPSVPATPDGDDTADPDPGDDDPDADPDTTIDDADPDTAEPLLPESRPPEEIGVYVRNGSGVGGAAGRVTNHLVALNYVTRSPDNAPERVEETTIYYEEGWRPEALRVADELNVDSDVIERLPVPAPYDTEMGGTQILIILGEDERIGLAQGGET